MAVHAMVKSRHADCTCEQSAVPADGAFAGDCGAVVLHCGWAAAALLLRRRGSSLSSSLLVGD